MYWSKFLTTLNEEENLEVANCDIQYRNNGSKKMSKKDIEDKIKITEFSNFVKNIKQKILSHQYEALKTVNKELITLYWEIGQGIVEKQEIYGWGKSVVKNLSIELQKEFVGMKGFSIQNLWNMRQFYLEYKDNEKLQTLSREIGWSHNVVIFQKCKESVEREFYIKMVINLDGLIGF